MAKSYEELLAENERLKGRLDESEELLRAIGQGEVDALVVSGPKVERVFTLEGADRAYRILIEAMNDGAITISTDGIILYCNYHFAEMAKYPLEKIIGSSIYDFIPQPERSAFNRLLQILGRDELTIRAMDASFLPVYVSVNSLSLSESQKAFCIVFTNLTEQKRKDEIMASERLARSIIEQANEAIVVCDEEGKVIRFSNAVLSILGYDPLLLQFEDIFDLKLPTGEKLFPVSAALRGEILLQIEVNFERGDGSVIHQVLNAGPLKGDGDRIKGCVITLTDITERKQMEESLRKSEEKYRTAIEFTCDWETWLSPEGDYIYVSPSCERITGYSADKFLSDPEFIEKIVHPDDRILFPRHLNNVDDEVSPANFRIIMRTGEERWISHICQPAYSSDGRYLGRRASNRDITDLKLTEEALRESQQKYQALIETTGDFIWEMDSLGRYTYCSPQIGKLLGLKPEEMKGKTLLDMMPTEGKDNASEYFSKIVNSPNPFRGFEIPAHDVKGRLIFLETNGVPFFDNNGRLLGFRGISRDITDHKLLETGLEREIRQRTSDLQNAKEELEITNEELQIELEQHRKLEVDLIEAKDKAEEAAATKAAFLANMSHELRTPMNAVIGFTSLLLDEALSAEQREYTEGIRRGGDAMIAVINDILEFSRADKEKLELEHQPFSLKHCIESSLDMVASQAQQKGLNLFYTISYGTPDTIVGDHGRLRQVLINVLGNAVKFTDEGDVDVSVSSKKIENNKRQILFSVKDTGIGIPPDKLKSIFEPFAQVEHIISRKRDGIGLGLSISRKLVELMGGEIWAESNIDQGTTFRFTIQTDAVIGRPPHSESSIEAATDQKLTDLKSMSILVAEDNPSNQRVLVQMLKRMGYRPDAVADGKEVLKALELRPYDLILMDIKMPEMDGITATKEIRRLWPENGPRIIAITAYALEGDRGICLEAGMDDYVSKPVQMNELASILAKHSSPSRSTI